MLFIHTPVIVETEPLLGPVAAGAEAIDALCSEYCCWFCCADWLFDFGEVILSSSSVDVLCSSLLSFISGETGGFGDFGVLGVVGVLGVLGIFGDLGLVGSADCDDGGMSS